MKRVLTNSECLEIAKLAEGGLSLEQIRKQLKLKCSRQTIWRAWRSVRTAEQRIAFAERTGIVEGLSVGEMLIALRPYKPEAAADEPSEK